MSEISKQEFSQRELVAGTLIGTRTFRVDGWGRLTGVSIREVWRPGINTATCNKVRLWKQQYETRIDSAGLLSGPPPEFHPLAPLPHEPGQQVCECGYYAYFDEIYNPYYKISERMITGIVEGFGIATVGTRGFRAQKARILALARDPGRENNTYYYGYERIRHNYSAIPFYDTLIEAVRNHPMSTDMLPGPDNTEDFWGEKI